MEKLTIADISNLTFGNKVLVSWENGDKLKGVVFGHNIGYTNGDSESLLLVADRMSMGICRVYKYE